MTRSPLQNCDMAIPFIAVGTSAIILGGLFSAATARFATYHSAWFVAYLVLVVGIAQVALGLGQWWLAAKPLKAALLISELLIFNVGNGAVMFGSMTENPLWVDVGSGLVAVSFAIFAWAVWRARRRGVIHWAYWALLVLLLVSVFIGIYFAHS